MSILQNILPEISCFTLGMVLIVLKLISKNRTPALYGGLSILWLAATAVLSVLFRNDGGNLSWGGMYFTDTYALFFKVMILGTALLILLASLSYAERFGNHVPEFFAMLVFATLGMIIFSAAADLTVLYLGLELMTFSFIILICFLQGDNLATEAGMKYLLLSAMSSAVMLFGLSLLYGFFGSTMFIDMAQMADQPLGHPLFITGLIFLLSGFAFKVSAVPFHMWAPDIYQGAPTPVAGYLAVGSKAAALALLARVLLTLFPAYQDIWGPILVAFVLLSVIFGNLVAIVQKDVKRMLAYSAIAQVGYLLLGILVASQMGIMAMMYYLAAYVFANTGAFIVASAWEEKVASTWRDDYIGMSKRAPLLAAGMFVFLVSLGGLPPMAGFIGKFLLFTATIDAGYYAVAVIALLMSMVSVYYYFQVIRAMYITKPAEGAELTHLSSAGGLKIAIIVCMVMSVVMGLFFGPIMTLILHVSQSPF